MIIYFLIFVIYINDIYLYFLTKNNTKKLMTELTQLQDFTAKIVTTQNLEAILTQKKEEITKDVQSIIDADMEKLATALNEITAKLNTLS